MGVADCTGPRPICAGSSPAHSLSAMRPRGVSLNLSIARSEASTSHAAPSPSAVGNAPARGELELTDRRPGGEHEPRRAVGHLRAVAGGDIAVLAIEEGTQLGEIVRRRVLAHAVVLRIHLAALVVERHD